MGAKTNVIRAGPCQLYNEFAGTQPKTVWGGRPRPPIQSAAPQLLQTPRQQKHQRRLPIDRDLVARVRTLIIRVHLRRRQTLRQRSQYRILTSGVRAAREESRPRFLVFVRSARPVMRMSERVLSQLRYPRERESIPPEQVMQVVFGGINE